MILPEKKEEKIVAELLQEYVELQQQIKGKTLELDSLKDKIDSMIPDDKFAIEGVAIFNRKKGSVRKNFDKDKAKEYLTQEQYSSCITETQVKPSISIISWDNNELRKAMFKGNKEQ